MGAGLGRRGGVVRWSTATRMFVAWGLTLPAAGLVGAGAEFLTKQGTWGVVAVAVLLVGGSAAIWLLSRRKPVGHGDVAPAGPAAEPAGVVTTAIAAVTPPPTGAAAATADAGATVTADAATDLMTTIPAPAGTVADPARPATV